MSGMSGSVTCPLFEHLCFCFDFVLSKLTTFICLYWSSTDQQIKWLLKLYQKGAVLYVILYLIFLRDSGFDSISGVTAGWTVSHKTLGIILDFF